MRGTRLALTCLHQHRLTSVEREVRGRYLATAANAVDHAVERRVLLVDWIVRIHQVFLRGHLIGARLAVADRCGIRQQLLARVRRWRGGWIWRTSRLRYRHRSVDQGQQRYRRDQLSHNGSPELGAPFRDHGSGRLDHKVRQASRFVQMSNTSLSLAINACIQRAGARAMPHGPCRPIALLTIAGKKMLTVHAKWIGRYDRRGVKLRHGSVLSIRAMRARGRLAGAGGAGW